MLVEGRNAVLELIKTDTAIDIVYVGNGLVGSAREIIGKLKDKKIKYKMVDKEYLDQKSTSSKHQGFIAVTTEFCYSTLEEILELSETKGVPPFIVILDGICDPHNLGSILRTCECMGVHGVIIGKNRAVSVNDTVVRISQGASSHIKVAKVTNINETIKTLKKAGVFIYGADSKGEVISKCNLKGSVAVVIGSEGEGISRLTKELCDQIISIPMYGEINSLNAGVACGIALYEVVRQNG